MISGDASCVVNYLEVFDVNGASIYASGNASSRVGPFEITCPGSTISGFSFHCNDGSAFPTPNYAALNTISGVTCTNGAAASIVGLQNVCSGTTVGTIGSDPTLGTCTACTPGVCPATPCSLQSCALGPSPLDAPWPMMGQDPAHRSTSPFSGPQAQPTVAWSEGGGAYDGVTVGNDGAVYSSVSQVKLLTAYNGSSGQIIWTTLNSGIGSSTYAIGPTYTLLGNYQGSNAAIFSQSTGALSSYVGDSTSYGQAGPDITLGADLSMAVIFRNNYLCYYATTFTSNPTCTSVASINAIDGAAIPLIYSGSIYLATSSFLFKISPSGPKLASIWNYPSSPYGSLSSPTISVSLDSLSVFVGSSSGTALSISASSGTLQWAATPCPQACTMAPRALPVPSPDGTKVFFPVGRASPQGYAGVVALSATTGATQWTLATSGDARSLALDASGILYVGDASGSICAVRSASGVVVWTQAVGGAIANLAIGANSFLYAATNASLVALR